MVIKAVSEITCIKLGSHIPPYLAVLHILLKNVPKKIKGKSNMYVTNYTYVRIVKSGTVVIEELSVSGYYKRKN